MATRSAPEEGCPWRGLRGPWRSGARPIPWPRCHRAPPAPTSTTHEGPTPETPAATDEEEEEEEEEEEKENLPAAGEAAAAELLVASLHGGVPVG